MLRTWALRLTLLAGLTACGTTEPAESPPDRVATVRESPTPFTGDPHEELPVGAVAPFGVYAHCGFEFTQIDGELWRTRLRHDGHRNPPSGWPEVVEGTVERTSPSRAVFVGGNVDVRAVFRPAPHAEYLCA